MRRLLPESFRIGETVTAGCGYDHLHGEVTKTGRDYLHIFVPAWNKTILRLPFEVQRIEGNQ